MPSPLLPWLQALVSRIPSEPEEVIAEELAQVVRDFCREALPWQDTLTGFDVLAADPHVEIIPPDARVRCVYILRARLAGQELGQVEPGAMLHHHESPAQPRVFSCVQAPHILSLLPAPPEDILGQLSVHAALSPADPADWLPSLFETHHFEAILDGTLGRFYNQPMKPYTDKEQARYHLRRYRALIQEARHMAQRGYVPHATNWAFPRFGA